MKRIILMMLLVAAAVVDASAGEKRNLATDAVLQLVMDHRGKPGFDTISVGKMGLGLVRMVLSAEADDPEEKAVLDMIKGVNKFVVVNYEDASQTARAAFTAKLNGLFGNTEKIIEVKDGEDEVNIYGTSVNGGESIDDIMIYIPSDCTLICVLGSISADRIADIIEMSNE